MSATPPQGIESTRAFSDPEIGQALLCLRKRKGLYLAEVAGRAHLNPDKLKKAECGTARLTAGELSAVLAALGVDFRTLDLQLVGEDTLDRAAHAAARYAEVLRRVAGGA